MREYLLRWLIEYGTNWVGTPRVWLVLMANGEERRLLYQAKGAGLIIEVANFMCLSPEGLNYIKHTKENDDGRN